MFKKISVLLMVCMLMSSGAQAFDHENFTRQLGSLAEGISQAAFSVSETADSGSEHAFEAASERAQEIEQDIASTISSLETQEDIAAASNILKEFSTTSDLNEHTAAVIAKMLSNRASFLNMGNASLTQLENLNRAASPELLLNQRQRNLIMIEIPEVEATLSFDDNGSERRLSNIRDIFKRHNCRVISNHSEKNGRDETHNFYFSGRKHVVDAVLGHFGGDIIQSDLKAVVTITTGGFWSGKSEAQFVLEPKRSSPVMGELAWYKSVIEKDPFRYFAKENYNKLATLGKVESVAGENKLLLRNAIVEIWVASRNGSKRNAIYTNKIEFGDTYVAAEQ